MPPRSRAARAAILAGLLLAGGAAAADLEPTDPAARAHAPGRLLVRFESEGAHALEECAEALTLRNRAFRTAAADGSDSLDRLNRKHRVRGMRALFRRPDGRSFRAQQERLRARLASRRPTAADALPDLAHVYRVALPPGADIEAVAAQYRDDPHVVWAQPDFTVVGQVVPDDPFYLSVGSWGQPFDDLWGIKRIGADQVWDVTQGEGVVVAVNDSGVDYTHPDLAANIWINPGEDLNQNGVVDESDLNGLDDDDNGFVDDLRGFDFANSVDLDDDGSFDGPEEIYDPDPFDDVGHGTHIAGTIAAVLGNGIGVVGVAPRARIMALKGLGANNSGAISNLARGIVYAAENGAQVVNNSWSCARRCPSNPIAEEAVRLAHALDVVLVSSAGNRASDASAFSPQNMRETLIAASSDQNDDLSFFSNRGFTLDVAAPGAASDVPPPELAPVRGILSTRSSEASEAFDAGGAFTVGERYLRIAGTSMSAPHVAGVVALVRARRPDFTNEEVRAIVRRSALDLGEPGHDAAFGAGRLDAVAAVSIEEVPRVRSVLASPAPSATVQIGPDGIEILGTASGEDFAAYALFVAVGASATTFSPIGEPVDEPVEDGLLGRWANGDVPDGPYVLRLEVRATDGSVFSEHVLVTAERSPPVEITGPGADALRPAISGDLVAWQSARTVAEEPEEPEGQNLFLADLRDGRQFAIAHGPGEEVEADVSGNRVVWLDRGDGDSVVFSCTFEPPPEEEGATEGMDEEAPDPCPAARISSVVAGRASLHVDGDRIVWSDSRNDPFDIYTCRVDPETGTCPEHAAVDDPGPQSEAGVDGVRAAWIDLGTVPIRIVSCTFDPGADSCTPVAVGASVALPFHLAFADGILAWVDFLPEFALSACVLADDGACDAIRITTLAAPTPPRISGRRIVWSDFSADGGTDPFFCELDARRRVCPVQRLTSHPAVQTSPDVSGDRMVWIDQRNGSGQVVLVELPHLDPIGDRVVDEGKALRVPVTATDPTGAFPSLFATAADGSPLEDVGASFLDAGDGTGELLWTPGADQSGEYLFTVKSLALSGLETVETIRVEVRDVNQRPVIVTPRVRVSRVGRDVTLDACDSFDPEGEPLSFRWRERGEGAIGRRCRVRVDGPDEPTLGFFRVVASDGEGVSRARVLVLWLPRWWSWW